MCHFKRPHLTTRDIHSIPFNIYFFFVGIHKPGYKNQITKTRSQNSLSFLAGKIVIALRSQVSKVALCESGESVLDLKSPPAFTAGVLSICMGESKEETVCCLVEQEEEEAVPVVTTRSRTATGPINHAEGRKRNGPCPSWRKSHNSE